ncbi:MAG: crotonase/enoyl-CoA hydratase family protein [Acidimicrobiia bacterium]
MTDTVLVETRGRVRVITINRPEVRNAVDLATAIALDDRFAEFEDDATVDVAVLTGAGGTFCSGADLKALAEDVADRVTLEGRGPMGPTRRRLTKPVIAAIEGYAVAGGLELAIWCDLRVVASGAIMGVFCRRLGVPLVDGGTIRLPRLIGESRALDMILTGRGVGAAEAAEMGLANRVVPDGATLEEAIRLAAEITQAPQTCLRNDRASTLSQWSHDEPDALLAETRLGLATIGSGETFAGAEAFVTGQGRHGATL